MKRINLIAALAVSFAMWGCGHTATEAINSDSELTPQSFGGSRWGSDKDPLDSTRVASTNSSLTTTSSYVATTDTTTTTDTTPTYTAPAPAPVATVDTTADSNASMASSSTATTDTTTPTQTPAPRHRRMKKH